MVNKLLCGVKIISPFSNEVVCTPCRLNRYSANACNQRKQCRTDCSDCCTYTLRCKC
uniref:Uncharacterized protein n=1 Tax=Glossina palpalis gambiensis TaxID=67801 RepID=A0A1B0BJR8_9MUSC